ncbi:MAG: MarR family transcriptional regulator [Flavobacteriales bacterium]|nr:MarR family transcriptional regulator [Flavobacteriales bacterium]
MRFEDEIKQEKFKDVHHKAFLNLMFTSKHMESNGKEVMKPFGVTSQQYNVLRILKGKYPQLRSADEIKQVMIDKSPDLTRLLDRLLIREFVTRETCSDNRRKLEIGITKKGLKQLDKMEPALEEFHKANKRITKKEAEELSKILDKMRG